MSTTFWSPACLARTLFEEKWVSLLFQLPPAWSKPVKQTQLHIQRSPEVSKFTQGYPMIPNFTRSYGLSALRNSERIQAHHTKVDQRIRGISFLSTPRKSKYHLDIWSSSSISNKLSKNTNYLSTPRKRKSHLAIWSSSSISKQITCRSSPSSSLCYIYRHLCWNDVKFHLTTSQIF